MAAIDRQWWLGNGTAMNPFLNPLQRNSYNGHIPIIPHIDDTWTWTTITFGPLTLFACPVVSSNLYLWFSNAFLIRSRLFPFLEININGPCAWQNHRTGIRQDTYTYILPWLRFQQLPGYWSLKRNFSIYSEQWPPSTIASSPTPPTHRCFIYPFYLSSDAVLHKLQILLLLFCNFVVADGDI